MSTDEMPAERTALVTGAGSERGIGRAVAARLAKRGWSIAIADIDQPAAENVAASISSEYGVSAMAAGVNIADQDEVLAATASFAKSLPPILGLANVAGVASPVPFLELTAEEWDRVFNINIRGQFFVTQAVLPNMIAAHWGRIVSVSSASAQRGGGTYSKVAYSAAKAGVLGMTRALAREVGREGVTVNAVSPGPIDTDIMGGTLTDERRDALVADLVVDRLGRVDDIAAAIAFLMSEDAGYITGATYNVNGGLIVD